MKKTLFLLYHDLDSAEFPSEKTDLATRETVVRLNEFEGHMACLAENGWNVISVRQFLQKQKQNTIEDKDIVLTFDDGHQSNYHLAFPVLLKYGFHATFFVIADRIGAPYHMNSRELRELVAAGMEIGSHGLTHTYLPELPELEVVRELAESKTILEDEVGPEVKSFAYPGGHYNSRILRCLNASGYNVGISCIVGWNNSETNPFLLRRLEMRRGTSVENFQQSLKSHAILFYLMIDRLKRGVKNIVGLEHYASLRQKLYFLYPFKR